jgi:hypothetical protein
MVAVPPERRRSARADDPELRGRRSEPRALIGLRTSTETLHGRGDATLLNLSCAGAQLGGQGLPGLGKDVLLTCGTIEIFGTVAWAADGHCGVTFDEPISSQVLSDLRRTAAMVTQSRTTQEEMEAAADWLNGLAR